MKASVLYDIVTKSDMCKIDKSKISGFRNRLSNYLKEIGLQKKRYNDGYYYYGIVAKDFVRYKSSINNIHDIKSIKEIEKERESLNTEILEGGINGDFFIVNKDSLNNLSFTPIFNIHP